MLAMLTLRRILLLVLSMGKRRRPSVRERCWATALAGVLLLHRSWLGLCDFALKVRLVTFNCALGLLTM